MAKKKQKRPQKKKPIIDRIKRYKLHLLIIAFILILAAISFAQTENIIKAMQDLCVNARAILATGAMILVILAAAVYAIGQIVGAETRARASVWATAMITGAVIGIIIYLILPPVIATMLGEDMTDPCGAETDGGIGSTQQAQQIAPGTFPGPGPDPTKPPTKLPPGWKKIP